jgi:hypothetical protein
MSQIHVLGIRHHGPGSARAVRAALSQLQPDLVLIEGPPELDAVVTLAASPGMRPPVAGLVYSLAEPARAAFYPMAVFSPEWVALRWAAAAGREARFLDLPAGVELASAGEDDATGEPAPDPIGVLAAAAGYDDPERWWEDAIELRYHGMDVFAAVRDAMRALREDHAADPHTLRREAAMRRVLRTELRTPDRRVAVVCGAWHAPVLVPDAFPTATADTGLLKGLPATKVAATWVPWTSGRLARGSGYGAGIDSPGWYHHLFTAPDQVVTRWLVKVARLLRAEQHDVSAAAVIEAVRLADALAGIRGRPLPGLTELMEASQAVLCGGSPVPMQLVARRLLVGDILGRVPADTPMVPLARDLAAAQKRLRLRPSAAEQTIDLDLRTDSHLARSILLHRLRLLDVPWGRPAETTRSKGTFRESWVLEWRPELAVALVEASGYGTTIPAAAAAVVGQRAGGEADMAELGSLVEAALLADLPDALTTVLAELDARAAQQRDTARLMAAIEPMARVRRYGNVRKADTELVQRVVAGLVTRVAVGLPAACAALDEDAAAQLVSLIDSVQRGIGLLDQAPLRLEWHRALAAVADQQGVPGVVAGRATRLLLDAGRLDVTSAGRRLSLMLSRATDATQAAGWLDGFLSGDAVLLIHEPELLDVIDQWVGGVPGEVFNDLLPLLRRTFAAFTPAERRGIGQHVRRLDGHTEQNTDTRINRNRADRVVPRLLELLGRAT